MNTPGAAVVGSSVVSFMAEVAQAQRESVSLALLMAEQSAQEAVKQDPVTDWLAYYRKQLQFYGWDAMPPEQAHWPDPQRPRELDKALQAIGETAGERHLDLMELAYQGLRNSPPALLQFEQSVRQRESFRLLPCGPAKGGRVDMVLYHEVIKERSVTTGFLFRERQHVSVRAELVRFNVRLFDDNYRERVLRALGNIQRTQIMQFRLG